MKKIQSVFVEYAPFFLLFPFSAAVGFYVVNEANTLIEAEYFPLLLFYIFLAIMPLYFIFFRNKSDFGEQILSIINKLFDAFRMHKLKYLLFVFLFSSFYIFLATIRISTYYERDNWILNDNLPIFPIDVVIPQRLVLLTSWFTSIDTTIALPNLVFVLGWFAFLVYVGKSYEQQWYVAIIAFVSTFSSVLLFQTMYASFEFPSAMLGFIGLYAVWKRKFNIGFFFLILSVVFKNSGLFQLFSGIILFLFICWKDGDFRKSFEKLNVSFAFFLVLYLIANFWGHIYYNLVLIDPSVLVDPSTSQVFWLSSFLTFSSSLLSNNTLLVFLGVVGLIVERRYRWFSMFSLALLFFTRSLSVRADSAYAAIFVPAVSFFSLLGIIYFLGQFEKKWRRITFLLIVTGINGYSLYGVISHFPGGMNHVNSNFDEFIGFIAEHFPDNGLIYQRDISIRPYLYQARGGDLDAMRFPIYPDNKSEFISVLSETGCKMIIAEKRHLSIVGISADEMYSMGYYEKPFKLIDNSNTWVAYSKECD